MLAQHLYIAAVLHNVDVKKRPLVYELDISATDNITQLEPVANMVSQYIPVLTVSAISSHVMAPAELLTCTPTWPPIISSIPPIISSTPILLCDIPLNNGSMHIEGDGELSSKTVQIVNSRICSWLCIDDVCGSFQSWSEFGDSGSVVWDIVNLFTAYDASALFKILHKNICVTIMGSMGAVSILNYIGDNNLYGMDAMFIPYRSGAVAVWLSHAISVVSILGASCPLFY